MERLDNNKYITLDNMYWNHNGMEQAKYDQMMNAGFQFTKATEAIFHSYYRYFNDGDFPGWARGMWGWQKWGRYGTELNKTGLEVQEDRVTEAILREYKRFQKKYQ